MYVVPVCRTTINTTAVHSTVVFAVFEYHVQQYQVPGMIQHEYQPARRTRTSTMRDCNSCWMAAGGGWAIHGLCVWWCCGGVVVGRGVLRFKKGVCSKRVSGSVVLEASSSRARFICTTVVQIGVASMLPNLTGVFDTAEACHGTLR